MALYGSIELDFSQTALILISFIIMLTPQLSYIVDY